MYVTRYTFEIFERKSYGSLLSRNSKQTRKPEAEARSNCRTTVKPGPASATRKDVHARGAQAPARPHRTHDAAHSLRSESGKAQKRKAQGQGGAGASLWLSVSEGCQVNFGMHVTTSMISSCPNLARRFPFDALRNDWPRALFCHPTPRQPTVHEVSYACTSATTAMDSIEISSVPRRTRK